MNSELKEAVRTYIAFWLAERAGGATSRITHSQSALNLAILSVCRSIDDAAAKRKIAGKISQIVHHIVRDEAKRGRMASEANPDPQEVAAPQTKKNNLIQPSEISDAIGGDLFVALGEFYTLIRDGNRGNFTTAVRRRDAAQRFYRLFAHYVRYASDAHGGDLSSVLRSNGMEPRIVQSVYLHGGEPFDADALEMLRLFFSGHIKGGVPEISDLAPRHIMNRIGDARPPAPADTDTARPATAARFLPYRRDSGVRDFMRPVHLDTRQAEEFREATGLTYQAFLNWGSLRPNPGKPSEVAWEAIAAFAEEEGRLSGLMVKHRPLHISEDEWARNIAEAESRGTPPGSERSSILELAIANRPESISNMEWNDYVDRLRKALRLEDATVEPGRMDALTAILPAYHFMRNQALEMGYDIDFFDYICSIYPIARRLREQADSFDSQGSLRARPFDSQGSLRARDGTIVVTTPRFMKKLPHYNRGYATWAQQILAEGLPKGVHPSTFIGHTKGDADQIRYWNIRRYTGPLAKATGNIPGQEERLYEFAFLMRVALLLDNAMRVMDAGGSLVTNPSSGAPSRYHIQMADDDAEYAEGIAPDSVRGVFADVRLGIFQGEMNFVEAYLSAIRNVPVEVNLTGPGGDEMKIDEITAEFEELSRQNLIYASSVMDTSPMAAYRSDEDNNEIREFYLNLRKYARRVTFGTHVRGTIETPRGPVSFQTIPRIPGQNIVLAGGEHITVLVDDLARVASEEKWSKKRLEDAFRLRVLVSYAAATGEMDAESQNPANMRTAVEPYWPEGSAIPDQAMADYIRLEEMAAKDLSKELGQIPPTARPTGGAMTELGFGPFLPARRSASDWRGQFLAAAGGHGLSGDAANRGISAIEDYFRTTRGFYRYFWPNTLRRITENHATDKIEAAALYDAIVSFLPTIGAASEVQGERRLDSGARIELHLARFAFEDYIALFPRLETAVPEDMHLLSEIAARHIEEHAGASPKRSLVVATARQMLGHHNAGRENAPWDTGAEKEPLRTDGLLKTRIEEFVSSRRYKDGAEAAPDPDLLRRAYFRLLPRLRKAGEIDRMEIESAIKESAAGGRYSGRDIDLLATFVEIQMADVKRAVLIITDPDIGVEAYLRGSGGNFSKGLAALATRFVVSRLLENLPTDINSAALDVVGEELAPFSESSEWMAGWHRHELSRWLSFANEDSSARASGALENLELVGQDTETPPEDFPAFLQTAANLEGEESFDSILASERDSQLLGELTGAPPPEETLAQAARRIYDGEVVSNQVARARRLADNDAARARHLAQIEAELAAIVKRVADAHARSAEIFAWFAERPDIETMAEDAASALVAGATLATGKIGEMQDEVLSLALARDRAAEIMGALRQDPAIGDIPAIDAAIESADAMLGLSEKNAKAWRAEADTRIKYIRGEKEAQEAIRAAREMAGAIKAVIEEKCSETIGKPEDLDAIIDEHNKLARTGGMTREKFEADAGLLKRLEAFSGGAGELATHHAEKLAKLRDGGGEMKPARDILRYARTLEDGGILTEELRGAAEELSHELEDAEKTIELCRKATGKMQEIVPHFKTLLEAAENTLPLTEARGIPETSPLPESNLTDDGKLLAGEPSRGNIHLKAIARIKEMTLELAYVLVRRDGTYLVAKPEADTVANWKKAGRKTSFALKDMFGNEVALPAGEWGIRTVKLADTVEPGHPFAVLATNLIRAIKNPTASSELFYRLSSMSASGGGGRDEAKRLLHDLFAALALAKNLTDDDTAEQLVQRWAAANREALTQVLGRTVMARLFVQDVYKIAGAPGAPRLEPKRPPIYGNDYTPERHTAIARLMEREIEHPNEVAIAFEAGGKTHLPVGSTDIAKGEEFAARRRESIDVYDHKNDRTTELNWSYLDEIKVKLVFGERRFGDTSEYQRRVLHRIYSDPTLMELGYLLTQSPFNADVVHNILQPIFRTPPGRECPITLHEAQEMAVEVWRNREGFAELFGDVPPQIAERFPEIGLVGTHAKMRYIRFLKQEYRDVMAAIEVSPEMVSLTAIFDTVVQADPAFKKQVDAVFQPMDKEVIEAELTEQIISERLLSFYAEHRDEIIEILKREREPDMTYARYLTGFDKPWDVKDANSWEAFSPVDRMRIMTPELFAVKNDTLRVDRENLLALAVTDSGAVNKYRDKIRRLGAFARLFPELSGAAMIDDILLGDSEVEANHDLYMRIHNLYVGDQSPATLDREAYLQRFAEAHTSPEYIGHLRRVMRMELGSGKNYVFRRLKKIHGGEPRQTVAEFLTGDKKPWLPKIEEEPPAANARGPEIVRRPIFGSEYDKRAHENVRNEAMHLLANSDYASPAEVMRDIFHYRFFSDLGLMALGSQIARDWEGVPGAEKFYPFLKRLMRPMAVTPAGQTPPFSPYEAQEFLLKWHGRLFDGSNPRPELETITHPIFTEPNIELAKAHPETALVGAWQIAEIMEYLEKNPIEGMPSLAEMMMAHPDLAGAFTIMAVAPEVLDSNAYMAIEAFAEQYRLTKKAGKDTGHIHAEFVDIYKIYADKAKTALLSQEIYPGMTRARWLTGLDEPWKMVPRTWDNVPFLERLALLFPESQKMRPGFYRGVVEAIKEELSLSADVRKVKTALERFLEQFPEFEGALAIDEFLPLDKGRCGAAAQIYEYIAESKFGMIGSTREEIVERVVNAHTDPAYLAYIREQLVKPVSSVGDYAPLLKVAGGTKDDSVAKILTGAETPWLPEPFDAEIWGDPSRLLPISDLGGLSKMTDEEINSRIDALGILPRNPLSLARMIREVEGDGNYKDLTPGEFSRARLFQKIRCVARLAGGKDGDLLRGLLVHLQSRTKNIPAGSKKMASPSIDYEFLVKNRAPIIAAAQKARDERTEGRGTRDEGRKIGHPAPAAPARSATAVRPPIYGDKYGKEEHEKRRLRAAILLKESRAGQLLVEMKEGGSYGFYVDNEEFAGLQRLPASFDVLDENTGIWRRWQSREALLLPQEVKNLTLSPRFSGGPNRHALLNLFHDIYRDPNLIELGYLVNENNLHNFDETLSFFYTRFLVGIARSDATRMNPPMTLHEAQALALEVWRDYSNGGGKPSAKFAALFAKPDKTLSDAYSITGSVGIWQLNELIKELEASPIEGLESISKMMKLLPEFAGALAVIATVIDALEPNARGALRRITEICSMIAGITPARDQKFIDGVRGAIMEFFGEAGPAIQRALAREIYPGMTYARFLTGRDDATGNFPATWDNVEPLKKLAALMPESQRVRREVIHRYRAKVVGSARRYPSACEATARLTLELDNFADEFPDLAGALCISNHLVVTGGGRICGPFYHFADDYIAARASGAAIDKTEWTRRFVDMCTDPNYLSALREWMDKPLGIKEFEVHRMLHNPPADGTLAHLLTGSDTPWITEPRDEGIFGDPEKLLPPLDVEGKTPREIEVWINERIDALRIMPRTTIGLQKVMEMAKGKLKKRLAVNTGVIFDTDAMPVTFAKIMCVIGQTAYTEEQGAMFVEMLSDVSAPHRVKEILAEPWRAATLRAYEFLHKNRADIIARAREIANGKPAGGGPGGPGRGGAGSPAPAGGSGGQAKTEGPFDSLALCPERVKRVDGLAQGRRATLRLACAVPRASETSRWARSGQANDGFYSSVVTPPAALPETSGMMFANMPPPMMPMPMVTGIGAFM